MQIKTLRLKRALRAALMVLLMSSVRMTNANPVSIRVAQEVGLHFVNANTQMQLRNSSDLQLMTAYSTDKGAAAFYIFNITNGFVIVAAEDVAHPVLAYSFDRQWPTGSNLPSQVTGYLDDLANQIEAASNQPQDRGIATEWSDLLSGHYQTRGDRTQVGPLLTTTWDQGQYYNAMCPKDENGPGGHAMTGCIATAMAQIINYQQYPQQGRGVHSYLSYQNNYGTLTINFDESNYDYDNMPNALSSSNTQEEINSVAKLMYDCGVASSMQ